MARHRSPSGRRAHLGPPLLALPAAAGVGGAHRSTPIPQLTTSLPVRFVATVIAGGAVAAVGQQAMATALPRAVEGSNVLRVGIEELLGGGAAAPLDPASAGPAPLIVEPAVPIAPDPVVAGATELVKAADLQRSAAEAAVAVEQARAAEAARTAEAARVEAARTEAARARAAAARSGAANAEVPRAAERAAPGARVPPKAAPPPAAAPQAAPPPAVAPPAAPAVAAGGAVRMVAGRVTSGFGARWGSQHQGLDIAAPIGTPIRVPLGGTVISSGPASGFGLWVRVRHADGTITVYGHINRSLVNVGDTVSAGQVIAEVGNRGQSTGPHLHIEVVDPGGTKINPRPWLDRHGIQYV